MPTPAETGLVAVFGAGRNGSTLIGRLLDGSRGIWAHAPEINYLCVWDDLARKGEVSIPTRQNTMTHPLTHLGKTLAAETLVEQYSGHWREIDDLYVANLIEPFSRRCDPASALLEQREWNVAEFLPAFLEATRLAYAPDPQPAPITLFKTIETPYVDDYLRIFPGLRCLHMVRDPAGNFASAKRTWSFHKDFAFYQFGHDQLETFLDARWLPHARTMLRLAAEQPESHRILRYEDLKRDPAGTLASICNWLGVEPPADPDQLTVLGGRPFRKMPSNPSQPGIEPPSRVVQDMEQAFGYTEVLTARERALIDHVTGRLAQALGYPGDRAADDRGRGLLPRTLRLWLQWLPVDASERLNVRSRARFALEIVRRRVYITRLLARRHG